MNTPQPSMHPPRSAPSPCQLLVLDFPYLKTPVVLEIQHHVVLAIPAHPIQDRISALLGLCELSSFQAEGCCTCNVIG